MRACFAKFIVISVSCLAAVSSVAQIKEPALPKETLARNYFGADAPWFLHNIPFLEIDDASIQQIYYYRWQLYRAHIREIGPQGTTVLEFLDDVPWAREPFTDLNDSSSFHILEGRWLRNPAVVDSLIDHLYAGGGNDRRFSESIAAATEASTRVTGDPAPGLRNLQQMQDIYNAWDDHFDSSRNLYWIEPIADATEYTIASIDASGAGFTDHPSPVDARNGFRGGFAFRPTMNSYQYGNALAIARFARLAGKSSVADDYEKRAERLREAVLEQLWNPDLQHFVDRYQRSTQWVTKGDFIRGREMAGYLPWFYELLPRKGASEYSSSWHHLLSSSELDGPYGMRTVEPSYPRYMTQYRYDLSTGQPECQWNGPSWPFQTSQALTAMANLLNDYVQTDITRADYLRLLRQYTQQHYLSAGHPDLQEDYNPDTGRPIVGLPRSHHYNHSTYIDLLLSGLIGIRPRTDNVLEVNPLLPAAKDLSRPIHYFAVEGIRYHDHDISVVFDDSGKRYHAGRGLSVFIDGKLASGPGPLHRVEVALPPTILSVSPRPMTTMPEDLAANPGMPEGPIATASSSALSRTPAQAIDGRMWFFPENLNGWTPDPAAGDATSWLSIDLRKKRLIGSIQLYFFSNGKEYVAPRDYQLQYRTGYGWQEILGQIRSSVRPIANGENRIEFHAISAEAIRVVIFGPLVPAKFRLIEIEAFAPQQGVQ